MACGNGIDYKVMTLREISRYWSLMLDIYIFWRIDIISELVKKKKTWTIRYGQNGMDREGKRDGKPYTLHTIECCGTTVNLYAAVKSRLLIINDYCYVIIIDFYCRKNFDVKANISSRTSIRVSVNIMFLYTRKTKNVYLPTRRYVYLFSTSCKIWVIIYC